MRLGTISFIAIFQSASKGSPMTVTINGDNVEETNQLEIVQNAADEASILTCVPDCPQDDYVYDYQVFVFLIIYYSSYFLGCAFLRVASYLSLQLFCHRLTHELLHGQPLLVSQWSVSCQTVHSQVVF